MEWEHALGMVHVYLEGIFKSCLQQEHWDGVSKDNWHGLYGRHNKMSCNHDFIETTTKIHQTYKIKGNKTQKKRTTKQEKTC